MDFNNINNLITNTTKYKNQGHWLSKKKMKPDKYFGFLYGIANIKEERYYIGLKFYKHGGKKTRMHRGKRVKNTLLGTYTKWDEYCSSSKEVKEDIERLGKDNFTFVCIKEFRTRGGLVYAEANLQHKLDVLTDLIVSSKERRYYNKVILPIKFLPKESYKKLL